MLSLIKISALGAACLLLAGFWFINRDEMDPLMTPARKARIEASPHYRDGEFHPEVPHEKVTADISFWKSFLFPAAGVNIPQDPMVHEKKDLKSIPPWDDVVVWLGHSSFYMQLGGKKILIDPVSSLYASPFPFIDRAFDGSNVYGPEDIPDDLDVMVLSHDHWDHLDYDFVKKIEPKVHHVVTGLGNGGYYEKMGLSPFQNP